MSRKERMAWAAGELPCPECEARIGHPAKVWPRVLGSCTVKCIGCDRYLSEAEINAALSAMPAVVKAHRKAQGSDESDLLIIPAMILVVFALLSVAVAASGVVSP